MAAHGSNRNLNLTSRRGIFLSTRPDEMKGRVGSAPTWDATRSGLAKTSFIGVAMAGLVGLRLGKLRRLWPRPWSSARP